ncbi:MAG: 5/3-nucleotidase [Thermoleophilaceae bacterium]|jgi:5'-nucleotidase|nr:5/3-nucleotidase [Thermoleophilaceae bacterium]
MRKALLEIPGVELAVIAPDSNRSATARSITTRRPLWVEEISFDDGTSGFATDGTPVDCVRFATLGLIEFQPQLIVSGINHGSNLGDDITYSGTVAAALEGIVLGIPAIAVSQQAERAGLSYHHDGRFNFDAVASFAARIVEELDDFPLPEATLLNINAPAVEDLKGAQVTSLGKRRYNDQLELQEDDGQGRKLYRIYGMEPGYEHQEGTDLTAVSEGYISVTPLHFDLTDVSGMEALSAFDFDRLLRPAARELD